MPTYGCDRYGGFHNIKQCETAFGSDANAVKACKDVLYGIFPKHDNNNPAFQDNLQITNVRPIACPRELSDKSGMSGTGRNETNHYDSSKTYGMTHYWDCCKPSCAWDAQDIKKNNGGKLSTGLQCVRSGDKESPKPGDSTPSSCDGGDAFMCTSMTPFVKGDTLYGFVANADDGSKADCGTCYAFDIVNSANSRVTKAKVQVTNKGGMGDVAPYGPAGFDFLVPGGGFGDFEGCKNVPNWGNVTQICPPPPPPKDGCECGWASASTCGGQGDGTHCNTVCCAEFRGGSKPPSPPSPGGGDCGCSWASKDTCKTPDGSHCNTMCCAPFRN